jgi:hypothetical protein
MQFVDNIWVIIWRCSVEECLPIQKKQRKPDRYVYQYKKDKENQTDMSTNTKKTKKTRPICLLIQKRQRKPDRYVYQYKKDKENQTDLSTNTKKTKKTRPICLPIQKRQRKPDRYVYQYKKDKENQTDLSSNKKKTKKISLVFFDFFVLVDISVWFSLSFLY